MATYKSLPEVNSLAILEGETNFIVEYRNELYRLHNQLLEKKISIYITLDGVVDSSNREYGTLTYTDTLGNRTDFKVHPARTTNNGSSYKCAYTFTWGEGQSSTYVTTLMSGWADVLASSNLKFDFIIFDFKENMCGRSSSFIKDEYGGLSFSTGEGFVRLTTNVIGGGANEPT